MRIIKIIGILSLLGSCIPNEINQKTIKTAKDYFPEEKIKILIVGSFHFDYPGLDAHQTVEKDKIDVLKEPKKSEVTELVEHIRKFQPNKIGIEATSQWNATEKLRKYKAGEYRDKRDERYQLAMRIATEIDLDTLYSIDASNMVHDLQKLDSNYTKRLFKDFDFQSEDPYNEFVENWLKYEDKLANQMNMLDYFKLINSKESHQYGYGAYLVGDFKLDNERGADILSVWWYNRNVRIFRKLQQITENKDDRILLIFGNGHAAVLRQLIECSPEYELIEFDSL
jgi:hypothetical protein